MPYDSDTGFVSAPVSVYDVQRALGSGSNDVGTLCKYPYINHWSKMKPVAFPYIEPDRSNPMSAYGKTLMWYKGHPSVTEVAAGLVIGNYTCQSKCAWITCCGIKFLAFTNVADVRGALNPIGNLYNGATDNPLHDNFVYVPPVGGSAEPFRLVDFSGYCSKAYYNITTDYETEFGGSPKLIDPQNPNQSTQKCSIFWYSTSVSSYYTSFFDLFSDIGTFGGFTVILAKTIPSSTDLAAVTGVSITPTPSSQLPSDNYLEVKIDFSSIDGETIIAFYVAYISISGQTFYIPLMQSTGAHPNTLNTSFPLRRMYRSWRVEHTGGTYYPMSFAMKTAYSTGNFISKPFQGLVLGGQTYNRIYFELEVPRDASRTLTFAYNAVKIELDGQFLDSSSRVNLIYYTITSADNGTRFVLKNSEPGTADWGTSENITITPGTGTQTVYLAVYGVFANRHSMETIYGGTVWRVLVSIGDRDDWYCEYGGLDSSDRLSIQVTAVQ